MEISKFKVYIQIGSFVNPFIDKMAKWLRRLTVNPLRSAIVGSTPIFVVFFIGAMLKAIVISSLNSTIRVQISEKAGILKTLVSTFMENLLK